jgi:hypothetical protein
MGESKKKAGSPEDVERESLGEHESAVWDLDAVEEGEELKASGRLFKTVPGEFHGGRMFFRSSGCREVQLLAERWERKIRGLTSFKRAAKQRTDDELFGDYANEYARKVALATVVRWEGGPKMKVGGKVIDLSTLRDEKLREALEQGPLPQIQFDGSTPQRLRSAFFAWIMEASADARNADPEEVRRLGEDFEIGPTNLPVSTASHL